MGPPGRDFALSKGASKKNSNMAAVGEILDQMKTATGLGAQLELAQIWEHWAELAGVQLSQHGQPHSVKDGQLRVRADSAVWMHKFSFRKWQIIQRINKMARKELVNDLFVSLSFDEEPE